MPLREEIEALRQAHDSDRKRIEALETQLGLQQAEILKLRGGFAGDGAGPGALPVVHLQPHSARELPTLNTATTVKEPPPEVFAELKQAQLEEQASGGGGHEDADTMFKSAFEKLKTGELVGAANLFRAFAQKYPHHPAADNALLDEGIAYYGLHRYQDALDVFSDLARRYPAGDAVPEALWRSADCHLKLTQPDKAQAVYSQLIKRYPGSPEAARASAKLAAAEKPNPDAASTAANEASNDEGGAK